MNEGLLFYFDSVFSLIEQLKYKVHEAEAEHFHGVWLQSCDIETFN